MIEKSEYNTNPTEVLANRTLNIPATIRTLAWACMRKYLGIAFRYTQKTLLRQFFQSYFTAAMYQILIQVTNCKFVQYKL